MVDTSGYASDVAQKYQGLFITEVRIQIEGLELGLANTVLGLLATSS